ncbi:hypothetical protein N7475_004069 [Penicillium sp. IBT 31633x]|nr:hypothetical protein N7475_004069 [Penicillium sp. IBT 31633x]
MPGQPSVMSKIALSSAETIQMAVKVLSGATNSASAEFCIRKKAAGSLTHLQCRDERAQLQAEYDECKKKAVPDEGSGEKCPFVDLSTVNVSSKRFKIYCKRLDDNGGANLRVLTPANAHACIQACTTTDGCTRAVWQTEATMSEATGCWLRDYSRVDKVPTMAGGPYSSAHLQWSSTSGTLTALLS